MSLPTLHDTPWAPGIDLLTFAFDSPHQVDEHKPIYIDSDNPARSLNKFQTRSLVRGFIAGLHAAGLQKGDCVLVILANDIIYPAIYFGIIGAGGVYHGANPRNSAFELDHLLQLANPKLIITSRNVLPTLQEAATDRGHRLGQIYLLDYSDFCLPSGACDPLTYPSGVDNLQVDVEDQKPRDVAELLKHGESDWIRFSDEAVARSTPASMFSTSGTSGLPKCAISSHFALVSQHLSIETNPPYKVLRLMCLPFFHVFAALFVHVLPVRLGQQTMVMSRFNLEQYVNTIHSFQITDTFMAPPMVHALNKGPRSVSKLLQSIKYIGVGGAPIDSTMMQQLESLVHPSATVSQVWGMTEIGAAMLLQYPERGGCDGSIGRPLPGYKMRLLGSFGDVIDEDNRAGELQVLYSGMMTGYKNHPSHPLGEWYSTGDLMLRRDDKYFVVGRTKELIKVNGFQVAPAEVEAVLMSHPCVHDAAVLGALCDDRVSEVPRAYVVRETDLEGRCRKLSPQEIYDFARERLASYKALNGGVMFVDEIPRTASGKIQRFKLAQMDLYRQNVTKLLFKHCTTANEYLASLKIKEEQDRAGKTKQREGSWIRMSADALLSQSSPSSGRSAKPPYSRRNSACTSQSKSNVAPMTSGMTNRSRTKSESYSRLVSNSPRRSRVPLAAKLRALEAGRLPAGDTETTDPMD